MSTCSFCAFVKCCHWFIRRTYLKLIVVCLVVAAKKMKVVCVCACIEKEEKIQSTYLHFGHRDEICASLLQSFTSTSSFFLTFSGTSLSNCNIWRDIGTFVFIRFERDQSEFLPFYRHSYCNYMFYTIILLLDIPLEKVEAIRMLGRSSSSSLKNGDRFFLSSQIWTDPSAIARCVKPFSLG